MEIKIFETSRNGNKLTELKEFNISEKISEINLKTDKKYQTITGFVRSRNHLLIYLTNE